MAITKSAKKAIRKSSRRRTRNIKKITNLKSALKKVKSLVNQKKIEEAKKMLPKVYEILDKAAKTGLIKRNTASRKKSRIAKSISKAR